MTTELVTVSLETNAEAIQTIFREHDFHHIPVVDKGEALIGIISKEDFFKVSYLISYNTTGKTWTEKEYQALKANDFMTKFPLTLDPDDTIGLAADIFLANKFHSLPIVEDGKLVGMITAHDLLEYGFNSPFVTKEEEEEEII
jgi:CBS domain-containing protein